VAYEGNATSGNNMADIVTKDQAIPKAIAGSACRSLDTEVERKRKEGALDAGTTTSVRLECLRPRPGVKKARISKGSEPIRRKPTSRKGKKSVRSLGTPATDTAPQERIVESIEALLPKTYQQVVHKSTDEETLPDPQQGSYRARGYLPPLDEDVVALIEAIMANPAMGMETSKLINPQSPEFAKGLRHRNVLLTESADSNSYAKHIKDLKPDEFYKESKDEETSHGLLWDNDLENAPKGRMNHFSSEQSRCS
jgi:hypothetical protein